MILHSLSRQCGIKTIVIRRPYKIYIFYVTNFMEQRLSRESDSCSTGQELPCLL
jgi:hypothetical protein